MKPRLRWSDYFGSIFDRVRMEAYQVGLAEGELRGRMAFARELESQFLDHHEGISAEDAARLRLRQVH